MHNVHVTHFRAYPRALIRRIVLATCATLVSFLVGPVVAGSGAVAAVKAGFVPALLARVPGSNIVYVLGNTKCSHSDCFHLFRTNDNGASFTTTSLPPIHNERGSPTGDLSQLVFANSMDGYAVEGNYYSRSLYVTTNDAKSWQKRVVAQGRDIRGITVTSNRLYVMTMRCPHKTGNCTDFRLARSLLNAESWVSATIPNNTFSEGGFPGSVAAFGSHVWFTEALHSTWLVTSRDGGRTFTKRSIPWPTLVSVAGCGLTATSDETLWAECPTGMQVSYYYSASAGRNWTRILASKQIMGTGGIYFDPVSSDLALLDVGGPSFDIYRITNSAKGVAVVGRLVSPNAGPTMVFTSGKDALSISSPSRNSAKIVLRSTSNGGTSWRRLTVF